MKKLTALILCLLMILSTALVACNGDGGDEEETKKPKKTKTTTATTTAPTVEDPIPQKLIAQIRPEDMNLVLSNTTKNPVIVNIDENTTVGLTMHGWPTICKGDGDTIYAAASLRVGHVDPFGATVFYVSEDGGYTWSAPKVVNDGPVDDRDTGIVYSGNGRLLISFFTIGSADFLPGGEYEDQMEYFATLEQQSALRKKWNNTSDEEQLKSNAWLIYSDDYGATWSAPYKAPVTAPHGPVVANDGSLIFCGGGGSGFEVHQSRDGGKTWKLRATIEVPSKYETDGITYTYSEAHIVQLRDGSFVAGIRGGDYSLDESKHNATLRTFISYSKDGYTFTKAEMIEGLVGCTAHFLELSNGALLMTYQYRGGIPGEDVIGARGRVSYDGGKTWDEEIVISTAPINTDLGYPSTVELSDGTLITAYYQPVAGERVPSFLYTRWKLVEPEA